MLKLFSLALLPLAYAIFIRPRPSVKTAALLEVVAETTKSAPSGGIKRWFAKWTRGNTTLLTPNELSGSDIAGLLKHGKIEDV